MRRSSLVVAALFASVLPAAGMAEVFAAIAFSPSTGKAGTAWNYETQNLAETEAYYQCGVEDCDTVVYFTQCGAIAVGDGYGYGTAYASSLNEATDIALQYCDGYTSNCQITAAFCNDGY